MQFKRDKGPEGLFHSPTEYVYCQGANSNTWEQQVGSRSKSKMLTWASLIITFDKQETEQQASLFQ